MFSERMVDLTIFLNVLIVLQDKSMSLAVQQVLAVHNLIVIDTNINGGSRFGCLTGAPKDPMHVVLGHLTRTTFSCAYK